jgi:alanine dehydrogenase
VPDDAYRAAGAHLAGTAEEVWGTAELVCKVKEPVASEYRLLRRGQTLFTYLHLAADRAATDALLAAGTTSVAYETVQLADGTLPLLAPMSEVAGRLSVQVGAYHLMKNAGGAGVLLGGIPGVRPAKVVVIGAGVAGTNATEIAVGMRADVTVLDLSAPRLRAVDAAFGGRVRTLASSAYAIEEEVVDADLVIGAVLVAGARAPRLVSDDLVARMRTGSVLVDISVDQGGCFESSRPTTHADPTFVVHGSVFYCVANMPGAVPVTSTRALTNATLPYLTLLAAHGWRDALAADPALAAGLTTHDGDLYNAAVARAHGLPVADRAALLG